MRGLGKFGDNMMHGVGRTEYGTHVTMAKHPEVSASPSKEPLCIFPVLYVVAWSALAAGWVNTSCHTTLIYNVIT